MNPLPPATGASQAPAFSPTDRPTRAYPWLLLLSTSVAGLFCYLYLTKPVIVSSPAPAAVAKSEPPAVPAAVPVPAPAPVTLAKAEPKPTPALAPSPKRLPGDSATAPAAPKETLGKTGASAFEETNLRVQHILIAEAPGGARSRLEFEVPVLYRSRNLRWSKQEVTRARELLGKLADYQEKSRALRAEGIALLDAWNHLVNHSIPGAGLRADSPSLPANQDESARPAATLDSQNAIRLQSDGK